MLLTDSSLHSLKTSGFSESPWPPPVPPRTPRLPPASLPDSSSCVPDGSAWPLPGSLPRLPLQSLLPTDRTSIHPHEVCVLHSGLLMSRLLASDVRPLRPPEHPLPSSHSSDCVTSEPIPCTPLSDHFLLSQLPHADNLQRMGTSNSEVLALFLCPLYTSKNWQATAGMLGRIQQERV